MSNEDDEFLENLFKDPDKNNDKDDDEDHDEDLYKKQFYVLKEDIGDNINPNSILFKHNVLLSKLMIEDENEFPVQSDHKEINITNDNNKKEVETEKLIEQDREFLRQLNRINYLTFSPFALSFFEKFTDKTDEDKIDTEKEEKMLKMIGFNYDSFEINNDLLFNICQGFVDINRLKEENNISVNQTQQISTTEGIKSTLPTEANAPKEESDDEEINKDVCSRVLNWIKENNEGKLSGVVVEFLNEIKNVSEKGKKKEKNMFFSKWYERIKEIEEEEEMLRQKEIDRELREEEERKKKEEFERMEIEEKMKEEKRRKMLKNQKNKKPKVKKQFVVNDKDKKESRSGWMVKKSNNLLD